MVKKIKILALILLSQLNTHCQNMKTKQPIDVSKAILKIDSCGLYYNNQRLDLGTPIEKWKKVLGEPSRSTDLGMVWDKLGITLDDWQNERGNVAAIYIHFLNLDSPQGQAGELNYAGDFESASSVVERNMENGVSLISEERVKEINIENKEKVKNYVYPFTVYQGYVNLHGFPVGAAMQVAEINSYRKDLPFSGEFRYVDDDIDGVNDSGNTTDTFGGDYRAGGTECLNNRLQYYELTYTTSGALEYLKIGYEDEGDYRNRQERKKENLKK